MSYTHLTEEERYHIDDLKREGYSLRAIGSTLKRSPSTLSREIHRNQGARGWRPRQAHIKAKERLEARGITNVKRVNDNAWAYAKQRLVEEQWSPEQIAGRLKLEGQESISHETIYQRIITDKKDGGDLYTHLRSKKKRRKRYGSNRTARGIIPNRVDIDQRPAVVDSRKRVGDWEGDTIIGGHDGGAVIASMVERKSRYTILAKADNKTTAAVVGGIIERMQHIAALVHTVTFDNGREFAQHEQIAEQLGSEIYFAKPYHSWERGLNENTNGLVRQYFPKKSTFDNISPQELQNVENKINSRPRKVLGFRTPLEVFGKACQSINIPLRI